MKILVDADACPVKDIIVKIAKKYSIDVIMFVDTSHILYDDYSEVVIVDKGRDSVDFALTNRLNTEDIVITQDYGVAAMALSKRAYAVHHNGFSFNKNNIDRLLFERYLSAKSRRAGIRGSKHKKRTHLDDEKFELFFDKFINELASKPPEEN